MAKQLRVISASDPVAVMLALGEVLDNKFALFITPYFPGQQEYKGPAIPELVDDEVALVVESSGSTGTPKRIELTLRALKYAAWAQSERLGRPGQWLLALPLNFIAGAQVLVRSLLADIQPLILNSNLPFDPEGFFRTASLMTHEVRYTSLVPAQLAKLIDFAESDAQSARLLGKFSAILVGGQAVPQELMRRCRRLGVKVVVSYGMTETGGGCVFDSVPLDGVRLKIGEDSRLHIQGPMLARGVGEWLITNDIAQLDREGKLHILGRADRVIISGGLKVSLDVVEQLALALNGVEDAAAVALEDQKFGERVGIAYVGSPEVGDTIATQLAGELGVAAKPVRIIRVDRIPKLATTKTDLRSVAALFNRKSNDY